MAINILPLGMAISTAYAALTFGTLQSSPMMEARESRYDIDAGSISQTLNAWAASGGTVPTPLGAARLQQLRAEISNNELIVRGTARTVPVDAAATVSLQSGNMRVHVVDAHVNGLPAPDAVRNQLEQQLQSQVDQSLAGSGVVVRSVQLGDGKLELTWVGP
jgi:LmeA-like phospholipid-binding